MTEFKPLLTPEKHKEWVEECIIPHFTRGVTKSSEPTFVLVTGQSGAGKSYSSKHYAEEYLKERPVVFGTDDIRILHPQAMEIMKNDLLNYPFLTKKDAGMARTALLDYCFEHKLNVVVESILLSPDDYKMQTLIDARKHGYRVDVVALGVHRYLSEVSIFKRQEDQMRINGGVGFPATPNEHDAAHDLLPDILANMLKCETVDRVSIYNRGYHCFYDSNVDDTSSLTVKQRLRRSRSSSLNSDEMTDVFLRWQEVLESMTSRGASEKEMRRADSRYQNFLKNAGLLLQPEFRKYVKDENAPTI
ncbi:MAG: zeta toxin family protein [Alphaproteobacteria bacterium]|nr:zeta toxin family protein [Alphaproteobacteria bacterium]